MQPWSDGAPTQGMGICKFSSHRATKIMTTPYFTNGAVSGQSDSPDRYTAHERQDDDMEVVRELIVGDMHRRIESRLSALETRLDTLEGKLDDLRHRLDVSRRHEIATLAEGVDELGRRIRELSRT